MLPELRHLLQQLQHRLHIRLWGSPPRSTCLLNYRPRKVSTSSDYDGFGWPEYFYPASQYNAYFEDSVGFGGQYGYYFDVATGLYLLTHRYYDPVNGRFLTRDPVGYAGGLNLYSLGTYNPVNNQDPSGYNPLSRYLGRKLSAFERAAQKAGQTAMELLDEGVEAKAEYGDLTPAVPESPIATQSPNARASAEMEAEVQRTSHYSVAFEAQLQRGVHYPGHSALSHFAEANKQLHAHMGANSSYAQQLENMHPGIGGAVAPGRRGAYSRQAPPGTSWHHHPTRQGVLQLMPRDQHGSAGPLQAILHPGGRGGMENWGEEGDGRYYQQS